MTPKQLFCLEQLGKGERSTWRVSKKAMESGKFRQVVCRGEWADAPFRELRALGLIELTGGKCRMGRRIHRITHAGLAALKGQYAIERGAE